MQNGRGSRRRARGSHRPIYVSADCRVARRRDRVRCRLEACGTCITVTLPVPTRAPVSERDRNIESSTTTVDCASQVAPTVVYPHSARAGSRRHSPKRLLQRRRAFMITFRSRRFTSLIEVLTLCIFLQLPFPIRAQDAQPVFKAG